GESDVTRPIPDRRPRRAERKVQRIVPPHVVAGGINELELEVLRRGAAANLKGELVVVRERNGERLARNGVARPAMEVEVEPHGTARSAAVAADAERHPI